MGYTHYWNSAQVGSLDKEIFKFFIADAKSIVENCKIPLGNAFGEDKPILTQNELLLNGFGEENSCESFVIKNYLEANSHSLGNKTFFDFCKTRRKPYDEVVTAILLLFHYHFPVIRISSDGDKDNWKKGKELVYKSCGINIDIPDSIRDAS